MNIFQGYILLYLGCSLIHILFNPAQTILGFQVKINKLLKSFIKEFILIKLETKAKVSLSIV